jgi:adenylate cyclase class 2
LGKLGARGGRCVLEQNTLFDTPESDLRRLGRLLRLRIEAPAPDDAFPGGTRRAVLTAKAPAPPRSGRTGGRRYKEKLERELLVVNPTGLQAALRSLGFRPGFRYEKYRTTFHFRGLHLSLDETPVGTFLELEGSPRAIDRLAPSLGFSPRAYVRNTYWELYSVDCRRRGVPPGDMLLQTWENFS